MNMTIKTKLIAPCGINCRVCRAYLRERNHCPGCRESDEDRPPSKVVCGIRTCEELKNNNLKYCYECDEFPCEDIKHLDKRYRTRYDLSVIENLENIKEQGIRAFIRSEKVRWTCAACSSVICMHTGSCHICGK
ncbi:MAG: DUF3795 domain-containing protein [bacterium]|nr:DUF3795 domain-containing protein [bacterium]